MIKINNFKNPFYKKLFSPIEITFLILMIWSLPSLEAPKNIFLVLFLIAGFIRQLATKTLYTWNFWDWIFFGFIGGALLSSSFAGLSGGKEWGGFRMLLTYTCTGWLIYRAKYSEKQVSQIAWVIILSALLALAWGLIQQVYLHKKISLELHSVGHVNHSALYLSVIFGAALSGMITYWNQTSKKMKLVFMVLTTIFFFGLIISQSRIAFGIGIITTLVLIMSISSGRLRRNFLAAALVLIALPFFFNAAVIQKQLTNQHQHDILSGRDKLWNSCIEISRLYPIAGIGMNNWKSINLEDIKMAVENRGETYNPNNFILFPGHAHNVYLQALVERGVIGFLSLIILMTAWARQLLVEYKSIRISSTKRFLWGASFSAWITTFIGGLFNSTLHHETGILAALFLSLFLLAFKVYKSR